MAAATLGTAGGTIGTGAATLLVDETGTEINNGAWTKTATGTELGRVKDGDAKEETKYDGRPLLQAPPV
jgi:hypothetical protein